MYDFNISFSLIYYNNPYLQYPLKTNSNLTYLQSALLTVL